MKKKYYGKFLVQLHWQHQFLYPQVGFAEGAKPVTVEHVSINGFIDYEEMNQKLSQIE